MGFAYIKSFYQQYLHKWLIALVVGHFRPKLVSQTKLFKFKLFFHFNTFGKASSRIPREPSRNIEIVSQFVKSVTVAKRFSDN